MKTLGYACDFLKKILSVSSFDIRNKYFISIYFSYQSLEQMDYELFIYFFFYTVHSKATGKPENFSKIIIIS